MFIDDENYRIYSLFFKFISLDKTLSASKERIIVEKAKKHEH